MRGFALLVAAVLVAVGAGVGAEAGVGTPHPSATPSVDGTALAGHGDVAFVSRGALYVLSGSTAELRRVAGHAAEPSYSPDGRWLAFVARGAGGDRLWVAHADGTDAAPVVGLGDLANVGGSGEAAFSWSPARDELAALTGPRRGPGPARGLWLVGPSGAPARVPTSGRLLGAVWSPDGDALAYLDRATSSGGGEIVVDDLARDRTTTWETLPADETLLPVAWLPGFGILAYDDAGGGGRAASERDGLPLLALAGPHAPPLVLGRSPILEPPGFAASPEGQLALVEDRAPGSGRGAAPSVPWADQWIEICVPASCTPIGGDDPAPDVSDDPAWSANGRVLAYVRAPSEPLGLAARTGAPEFVWSWRQLSWWYARRTLWLLPLGGEPVQVPGISGVSDPRWSDDGRSMLCVANGALYLLASLTSRPVEIVAPLGPSLTALVDGYADWGADFAWSAGP